MESQPQQAAMFLAAALLLTAFFASSETVFVAIKPSTWLRWKEADTLQGRLWVFLHRHRTLTLTSTILGSLLSLFAAQIFALLLRSAWGASWSLLLAVLLIVPVMVLGFDSYHRRAVTSRPEKSTWIIFPLFGWFLLSSPLAFIFREIARLVLMLLGMGLRDTAGTLNEEELREMLAQTERHNTLPEPQRRMLYGVLDFADLSVAQVMTPRPDMISIEAEASLSEAVRTAVEHRHSRLPVYRENDDDIIGMLYVKDLLPYLRDGEQDRPVRIASRAAFFVPETLLASELLRQLQRNHQTVAVARDEFGGTAGLVTVEDLLEEIVGDIHDEYDAQQVQAVIKLGEREFSCDGLVSLHTLETELHTELPEERYESLAGLVLDVAGRIPEQGESFEWQNLTLVAERVQQHRLERVRILVNDGRKEEPAGLDGA